MTNTQKEPAWIKGLNTLESSIVTASLLSMIIIIFLQVVFRIIGRSLPWSEELARYLMTWVVFVGASMGAKEGVHIGVAAFVNIMPKWFQKADIVFVGLCSAIFGLATSYVGYLAVASIAKRGQISPAMEMPMWIAYLPICIGPLFMAVRFGQAMLIQLREFDETADEGEQSCL